MPNVLEPPRAAPTAVASHAGADVRPPRAKRAAAPAAASWTWWPVRDQLPIAVLAVVSVLASAFATALRLGSPTLGVVAAAALAVAFARVWLPVTYRVDRKGLRLSRLGRTRAVAWSRVSGYHVGAGSVTLYVSVGRFARSGRRAATALRVPLPEGDGVAAAVLAERLAALRETRG
ncbi:MAG: hypothetical protein AAGB00_10710 [Planctomycetota bacterium]